MIRALPLILRPKALSLKNTIRGEKQFARDSILLLGSLLIIFSLYRGTSWSLARFVQSFDLLYLPPGVLLSLIFLALFSFLLISSCVSALGALYLNSNLELVLASSVGRSKFFVGKLCEVAFDSSWLILVLFAPLAAAFARFYGAGPAFYLLTAIVTISCVLLATALGVMLVTIFALIVPASRARESFLVVLGLLFGGLVYLVSRLQFGRQEVEEALTQSGRLLGLVFVPSKLWSPTFWAGTALGEVLESSGRGAGIYLWLLLSVTTACLALSYIILVLGYQRAYTLAKSLGGRKRQGVLSMRPTLPWISAPVRGLITKEFKIFYRDTSYAFQVMMVLLTCAAYLFAMRFLNSTEAVLPGITFKQWLAFLALFNAAVEALLINTICLRFVFPAVSLEGQSLWVLQAAPLGTGTLLRTKFRMWFFPVALLTSLLFTLGGLSFGTSGPILAVKAVETWIIVYGMVGLAIGCGSRFANFNWDHTSQLAAGFGNLIFMVLSVILITVDLVLIWVPLYVVSLFGGELNVVRMLVFAVCLALLAGINIVVGFGALFAGERSLKARLTSF